MVQVTQVVIVAVSMVSNRMPLPRLLCRRPRKWCTMGLEESSIHADGVTPSECREKGAACPWPVVKTQNTP